MPGLTELVCSLGLEDQLSARSHECDYPLSITDRPILTRPKYTVEKNQNSGDIHQQISYLLQKALSVYDVDAEKLARLKPDVILTQDHCEVCAVSKADLTYSVRQMIGDDSKILSVSPTNIESILESFQFIADELGSSEKGTELVKDIRFRFDAIGEMVKDAPKPSVVAIEWIDPLMIGGNWMPEMIEIAGGINLLSEAGKHSAWIEWEEIKQSNPDILLIVPCGYSIKKTLLEMKTLESQPGWDKLNAVQQRSIYILDGNQYFNRPGPRIRDSVEILANIFHPLQVEKDINQYGWIRYKS